MGNLCSSGQIHRSEGSDTPLQPPPPPSPPDGPPGILPAPHRFHRNKSNFLTQTCLPMAFPSETRVLVRQVKPTGLWLHVPHPWPNFCPKQLLDDGVQLCQLCQIMKPQPCLLLFRQKSRKTNVRSESASYLHIVIMQAQWRKGKFNPSCINAG